MKQKPRRLRRGFDEGPTLPGNGDNLVGDELCPVLHHCAAPGKVCPLARPQVIGITPSGLPASAGRCADAEQSTSPKIGLRWLLKKKQDQRGVIADFGTGSTAYGVGKPAAYRATWRRLASRAKGFLKTRQVRREKLRKTILLQWLMIKSLNRNNESLRSAQDFGRAWNTYPQRCLVLLRPGDYWRRL